MPGAEHVYAAAAEAESKAVLGFGTYAACCLQGWQAVTFSVCKTVSRVGHDHALRSYSGWYQLVSTSKP